MLVGKLFRFLGLTHFILGALAATLLLSEPSIRRYGDNLQIALPLLAWGCSATKGSGREYALRFVSMLAIAHGTKAALGDAPLNIRPSGGDHGFPSAHTSAAAFGASSLTHDCLRGNIGAQVVVVIAAVFVGGSRIAVGAHDIWQVLAGGLLGWACDRALRRGPWREALISHARQMAERQRRLLQKLSWPRLAIAAIVLTPVVSFCAWAILV